MSTLSAFSWKQAGVVHSDVYATGFGNTPYFQHDGGDFMSLGGYVKQISASQRLTGYYPYAYNPVYAIGGDDAAYVTTLFGTWNSLGGSWKQISAGLDLKGNPEVFGIAQDHSVWVNDGGNWASLGGYAKQISATGGNTVYAIGGDNAVDVNRGGIWSSFGGYATQISATGGNTVYAIGGAGSVYVIHGGSWAPLGGYAKQISAGFYPGGPEVWAIGGDNAVYVNRGSGWVNLGGYATEISATQNNMAFVRGQDVGSIYVSQFPSPFTYVGSIPLANPAAATPYLPAPAGVPLFNNNQPSYLDVEQGAVGDCWLEASLAEVAARYPQDIKNMFIYDGTTVDNGSTVGLYSVRFFSTNGSTFYVKVDTELPSAGWYYDHIHNALGTQCLWVALAEKGYAEANALGLVTTGAEYQGAYSSLGGGDPAWALHAITGNWASDYNINPSGIANAWNSGQLIVLGTGTPSSSYIVGDHCYAVVNYSASNPLPFEVFNPWGTQASGWAPGCTGTIYGLFRANAAFISQNFILQSIDTGAIDVNTIAQMGKEITGLGTLDDGFAPSGTIQLTRHSPGGSVTHNWGIRGT
jgi:hypothetical protein